MTELSDTFNKLAEKVSAIDKAVDDLDERVASLEELLTHHVEAGEGNYGAVAAVVSVFTLCVFFTVCFVAWLLFAN